ncbi:Mth938-like domain-containing protein [Rhabdochromatium marinum]|uniref:Mth938-like domain-containing protein n=1 Tax=Rhabdochromatium marinum TaxID=48729 RepID=UPI001903B262|nr:MTH938/NDUFAF3 family protein [Rhabdochromatium marinum]MBK1648542.1 hypothetical protein [Rhabdochromatium marinum]
MKFSEILDPNSLRIEAYDATHFCINGRRFEHAVMLLPDARVQPWPLGVSSTPSSLTLDDLTALLDAQPQLILLGTGAQGRMPPPPLIAAGAERGIGIEWMHTGAACRTYNLLASEGRRVAAALLLQGS